VCLIILDYKDINFSYAKVVLRALVLKQKSFCHRAFEQFLLFAADQST
jgi:hypothetical protein